MKKYLVFTSTFGFLGIGVYLVVQILTKQKYQLLLNIWFKCLYWINFYIIIPATVGFFSIYTFFRNMPLLQNTMYCLLILILYFLGILALKNLLSWKQEVADKVLLSNSPSYYNKRKIWR